MKLIIDIPNEIFPNVREAFLAIYRYERNIENAEGRMKPNPQSGDDFLKSKLLDFVSEVYIGNEVKKKEREVIVARDNAKVLLSGINVSVE